MPRGNQLTRQWRLFDLLDRPAGVSVGEAADRLECAARTIWRDLRVLEDAGFPIYSDERGDGRRSIWKVSDAFRRRLPLKLSLAEVAALLMGRELLRPAAAGPLGPAIASAIDKIAGLLSRDALALIDQMRAVVGVRALGGKLQAPAAEHLSAIQTGLVERRRLRLRYAAMHRGEVTEREVDPYHLTLHDGGLYLIAHCHLRCAPRIFAVERIRDVAVRPTRFAAPARFDAEEFFAGAWGLIRGDVVTVKVVFARPLARYIRERLWHPSQRLRDLGDGRVELTLRVADTLEVRRWILGFGREAEVVEPAALREAIRQEAEAVAQALGPSRILGMPAGPRTAAPLRPRTTRSGAS
jgi:predicted DNA-binding transcriptional regulator YafY